MRTLTASEEIVVDLSRSRKVYRQRMAWKAIGPFVWVRPRSALRAVWDAFPFEAVLISIGAALLLTWRFGLDLGVALGASVTLVLIPAQLMMEHTYGTATHLVRRRGLVFPRRERTAWRDVADLRAEGDSEVGDLVLTGAFGQRRICAVEEPYDKQEQIRVLISRARRGTA